MLPFDQLSECPGPKHVEEDMEQAKMQQHRSNQSPHLALANFNKLGTGILRDQKHPVQGFFKAEHRQQKEDDATRNEAKRDGIV